MRIPVSMYIQGTVIDIEFPFQGDSQKTKRRPAVVTDFDDMHTTVILLKVTSHEPRTDYDYLLLDAGMAGLKEGSVIRCNHILTVNNDLLCDKRGDLSRRDFIRVLALYQTALISGSEELY